MWNVPLSFLVLLSACGSATLSTGGPTQTLVSVGGGQRVLVEVTDLDDVRDVVQSGERVFVATDNGLLVYTGTEEPPARHTTFPSVDVSAVAAVGDGSAVAAAGESIVRVAPDGTVSVEDGPPVGRIRDLHVDGDGVLWACGERGVARQREGTWARFGEDAVCTSFAPTAEGTLWVGTTRGMWMIEDGEIVREHGITNGIPEGYVRSVVPVAPNQIVALLQGPGDTKIGYWDGERWFAYTLSGFDSVPVGLARVGDTTLLIVPQRAYALGVDVPEAVPLTPLSRSELRSVRSYRARITPVDEVDPPAEDERRDEVDRLPSALAEVPPDHGSVDAPRFTVQPSDVGVPAETYRVFAGGGDAVFAADRNRGVARLASAGEPTWYRSRDLVQATDFQLAVDAQNRTWVLAVDGSLGRFDQGRLVRVFAPEGVEVQAIASGPQGAYMLTLLPRDTGAEGGAEAPAPTPPVPEGAEGVTPPSTPSSRAARVYRISEEGFTAVVERTLTTGTALVGAPLFAVANDETMWAGLRVEHENGTGTRMRGAATFSPSTEGVVYFHRGATPETDGEGALAMPDEIDGIDLGMSGYAWFPSLNGAIRLGNHQAVVFGEARGVRGEVVSDLAVGENERVWLAAAEGIGYYEASTFEFRLPRNVQQMHPNRIAMDPAGNVWGVSGNGAVFFDGQNWQMLTTQNGLPTADLVDVEVDAQDRAWLLARDRVLVFSRATAPAEI